MGRESDGLLHHHGLARRVLDFVPGLVDDLLDFVGHGHVVQIRSGLVAILVGPVEKLQCGGGVHWLVLDFLHQDEELNFVFLTDLCGVHYPNNKGKELGVVYHLHNLEQNIRVRMKVFTDVEKPEVFTATGIFMAANWMERETFDFFGINFLGHPNMKRILNVEEMDYSPLRKEFPVEDQSRVDKDDEMFGRDVIRAF